MTRIEQIDLWLQIAQLELKVKQQEIEKLHVERELEELMRRKPKTCCGPYPATDEFYEAQENRKVAQ